MISSVTNQLFGRSSSRQSDRELSNVRHTRTNASNMPIDTMVPHMEQNFMELNPQEEVNFLKKIDEIGIHYQRPELDTSEKVKEFEKNNPDQFFDHWKQEIEINLQGKKPGQLNETARILLQRINLNTHVDSDTLETLKGHLNYTCAQIFDVHNHYQEAAHYYSESNRFLNCINEPSEYVNNLKSKNEVCINLCNERFILKQNITEGIKTTPTEDESFRALNRQSIYEMVKKLFTLNRTKLKYIEQEKTEGLVLNFASRLAQNTIVHENRIQEQRMNFINEVGKAINSIGENSMNLPPVSSFSISFKSNAQILPEEN